MRSGPSGLSDVAIEGDHAVKAMLANAFLNLNKFPEDDEGNARVRRIIDYLIPDRRRHPRLLQIGSRG